MEGERETNGWEVEGTGRAMKTRNNERAKEVDKALFSSSR